MMGIRIDAQNRNVGFTPKWIAGRRIEANLEGLGTPTT
jgi:hypothetical protein